MGAVPPGSPDPSRGPFRPGDWQALGFRRSEAEGWWRGRIDPAEALRWRRASVPEPIDAVRWRTAGVNPDTVQAWIETFESNYAEAVELVGEETTRVWRLYLVGGRLAFDEGRMGVDQILSVRPVSAQGH